MPEIIINSLISFSFLLTPMFKDSFLRQRLGEKFRFVVTILNLKRVDKKFSDVFVHFGFQYVYVMKITLSCQYYFALTTNVVKRPDINKKKERLTFNGFIHFSSFLFLTALIKADTHA